MLGAIIGDIVGSRFEFNPTNDYHFELFTSDCSFTDDTICTIAVADTLLHEYPTCKYGLPFGEYIHRWCRRYPYPMGGYGGRFAQWVNSDDPKSYNSFGNGSAMRVSPVAWLADSYATAILLAKDSAECTHSHPKGIKGAQAVATVIFDCLQRRHVDQPLTQEEIERSLYMGRLEYAGSENLNLEDYRNRFDETCQGTVPVALKIIEESCSFEDAIRRAVSLGADADTLGAIVGSIAEAIWGIPEEIEKKALTYLPQEMRDVLSDFRTLVAQRREERWHEMQEMQERNQTHSDPDMIMESPLSPTKGDVPATAEDWQTEPMPKENISRVDIHIALSAEQMAGLRMGHIPTCQEDHWFMYVDDTHIHIYRSWTGICVFEARYVAEGEKYAVVQLLINHNAGDFTDEYAMALFRVLISA